MGHPDEGEGSEEWGEKNEHVEILKSELTRSERLNWPKENDPPPPPKYIRAYIT